MYEKYGLQNEMCGKGYNRRSRRHHESTVESETIYPYEGQEGHKYKSNVTKHAQTKKSETEDAGNSELSDESESEAISDHREPLKLPGM